MTDLSPQEKALIFELCGDLGTGPRPYEELGRRLGLSEAEVVDLIRNLKRRGYLRRFGATLRHQRTGFLANAMVAWRVESDRIDEVGRILAAFPEVTHCYQRRTYPDWTMNLYAMIHGSSEDEVIKLAERMAQACRVADYDILFSHEELKKTSMRYFDER